MRILLVFLGLVTVVLAVILAAEHLWWIAIPDAAFGIAVGLAAAESVIHERRDRQQASAQVENPPPAAAAAPQAPAASAPKARKGSR